MDERERLTGFCLMVMRYLLGDSPEEQALLKYYEDAPFDAAPFSGLREAVRDVWEFAVDLKEWQVAELNQRLLQHGLPSLSAMRRVGYRQLDRILARGHIASDVEWRHISGLMNDLDTGELTEEERSAAGDLLRNYERKV